MGHVDGGKFYSVVLTGLTDGNGTVREILDFDKVVLHAKRSIAILLGGRTASRKLGRNSQLKPRPNNDLHQLDAPWGTP